MFAEHIDEHLKAAERSGSLTDRAAAFAALRPLGLDDFGWALWNMPNPTYRRLSTLLPPMAPDRITKAWTGASGMVLLQQSLSFVRACAENYAALTGTTLRGKRILDFGCGYGRFLRLFSFYTDRIFGVDAWEQSLEHSRSAGFGDIVARSDEVPATLPVEGPFDFAFAFSVFTHLDETAALAALGALRGAMAEGGILTITFRPVEFWDFAASGSLSGRVAEVRQRLKDHRANGFAYLPHRSADAREVHYGDTSMTLDWLAPRLQGWQIVGIDRSLNDSLQRYAFLRAV